MPQTSWSSWCRSTFTTIASLSFTSPRCGAKTSDKRTIMFSCTNSMPCNLPVRCGFGTVSSWCVNCLSIVLFFRACLWSAACKQNSGTSSSWASLCALSTMLRAMFSQYMPTTWPCLKKSVCNSLLQFSILRARSWCKWSSDKGAAGVHVRMAAVICGNWTSRKRFDFFKWITVSTSHIFFPPLLQVIPPLLTLLLFFLSSNIISDISLDSLSDISSVFFLTFFLTYLSTFVLTFFLTYLLTFFLTYLLTFFLTYLLTFFLTFFLTYLLPFFLTYLLTFFLTYLLTFFRTYLLKFFLTYLSDISSVVVLP